MKGVGTAGRKYEGCRDGRQRDAVASSALQIKGRVRIQYICLVPIHVFPEMKQCCPIFPKQNYNDLSLSSYTHISVRDLYTYFQDRSVYFSAAKYVDRSWDWINRSQTHEFGIWDWDGAIPRKGIHKWDFLCSVKSNHHTTCRRVISS